MCVRITKRKITFLALLVILFTTNQANADYVQITEQDIKTKFYAKNFTLSVDSDTHNNRLGIGYGHRSKHSEVYYGLHDNLLPYVEYIHKLPHVKTIVNAYVETEDTEKSPDIIYGLGGTLLLSDSFGFYIGLERNTWLLGVRKWF